MTRDDALAKARELWGDRAQTCVLGKSYFVGFQKSKHEYDWRGWGGSWEEALNVAIGDENGRRLRGKALKEKFSRIPVRIEGNVIVREWHGKQYTVTVLDDGYEFAGTKHSSLTAIAKIVTGAKSISGPRFFGVDQQGGAA